MSELREMGEKLVVLSIASSGLLENDQNPFTAL